MRELSPSTSLYKQGVNMSCKCNKPLSIFEQQAEFMEACDQYVGDITEEYVNDERADKELYLWAKLIDEEYIELNEAIRDFINPFNTSIDPEDTLVNVSSEAIDLIYVTLGLLNNLGVNGQDVFDAIHKANMDKVGVDGKVIKNSDGKVLKPDGWKPADIKAVIFDIKEDISE